MQMPAVPLVCDFDRDASASDAAEDFSAAHFCEAGGVLTNLPVSQHGEIFLCQDEVFRRADFRSPQFDDFLPLGRDSELASGTPFDVATVSELFELPATFARSVNFLVAAPAEIPELRGVVKAVEMRTDGFMEVVVFVGQLQLLILALASGDGSRPDEGLESGCVHG